MHYSRTAAVAAGLASAAAFAFGTGLEPHWPLTWLAPLPVLAVAYGVTETYGADVEGRFGAAAARNRVTVVAGLNEIVAPLKRNVALVFGEDGAVAGRYLKRRFIPGIEDGYLGGEGPLLVPAATPAWGVAICKDLDFPAVGREYAARSAALVAVPAWDFVVDGWWHDRMAAMRAVESGSGPPDRLGP